MNKYLILSFLLNFAISYPTYSAKVYYSEPEPEKEWVVLPAIYLEGTIKIGDYDNLLRLIKTKKNNSTLFIKSSGGNVQEAMRIGNLIRKSYISVSVIDECSSACFLIYSSAVTRSHNSACFGLHRPFFDKEKYKLLPPEKAQEAYTALESAFKTYLFKNRVPYHIIDKIMLLSSIDAWVICGDKIDSLINKVDAAYEELLIAKCGTLDKPESYDLKQIYTKVLTDSWQNLSLTCIDVSDKLAKIGFSSGYCQYLRTKDNQIFNCQINTARKARSNYLNTVEVSR